MRKAYARDEIREQIEAEEKAERDAISRLHASRQEGLVLGREEGREEERRSLLSRLLKSGMSKEQLTEAVGLTEDEWSRVDLGDD